MRDVINYNKCVQRTLFCGVINTKTNIKHFYFLLCALYLLRMLILFKIIHYILYCCVGTI